MKKSFNAPLGATLIVLSSFFYASYGIWTKLMGDFFGGYTASGLRSILVVLFLLPPALWYRKLEPMQWRKAWKYMLAMIIASTFVWGPLYYAIQHAGVGISLTVNYALLILGMFFFGWLFDKERYTADKFLATALGIVGLAMVFSPSMQVGALFPLLLSAISGFAVAGNMVITKRLPYNSTQSTLVLWETSIIANFIMAFVFREHMPQIGAHVQWFYLVLFAIASVTASWMFVTGLKMIEAGAAGILGLLEVVFAVIFGVVFFHEKLDLLVVLGIVVIIASAAIPYLKDYNAKRGSLE